MASRRSKAKDDYYEAMYPHRIRQFQLYKIGFPLMSDYQEFYINEENYFGDSSLDKQKCRCQQTVSLLNNDWYYAADCRYHPLKLNKNSRRFECCGNLMKSHGCISSNFHTCSYIPLDGDWYRPIEWHYEYEDCPYLGIFSLDCEFVFTTVGMEVARISLVSIHDGVVYDHFVEPKNQILDYNTQFSGITPEDLKKPGVYTLSQVQYDLTNTLLNDDSILIGHGLHSDLRGLHICHESIIDTSILYPHFRGYPFRYSLEYLAKEYLGVSIHGTESGHNSVEDAKISLSLVALKCGLLDLIPKISKF